MQEKTVKYFFQMMARLHVCEAPVITCLVTVVQYISNIIGAFEH